jgi:two-component system cell cycle sensor histidine kinase/response regulator CckA
VPSPGNSFSTPSESVSEAELYRNLAENGRDLICQTGATGRYLYASPNHLAILGYSGDELPGQSFFKHVHPDDLVSVNRHYVLGLITHQPAHLQFRFRHKSGEWRWLETNGQPIFGRGKLWRATLVLRDVTRRRQAEEELRQAHAWSDALLASTTHAVATLDDQGQLASVGARLCELSGYSEEDLQGQPWLGLVTPDEQYVAQAALHEVLHQNAARARCEVGLRDAQGGDRRMLFHLAPLMAEGKAAGAIVTGEDLTELRQSEESREYLLGQLEVAQKLESIGKMSAGVAHDFNNVLAGALTTTELLKAELEGRPDLTRLLSLQQRAIERAIRLTQQLLAFTRHEEIVPGPVDLSARARDILEFCSTQFDRRIEVDNRIPSDLPPVLGDACQLDQILLNLLLNAGQSLVQVADEGREPRITLDACAEALDPDIAQRHGLTPGDPMLHVAIHDNGPGIREELQAQIFDPFFTTKSRSHNHGLGLSTTHTLVKNHRGAIEVDSQPGCETSFHIYLPICTPEMLPGEQPEEPAVVADEAEQVTPVSEPAAAG